MEPVRFNKCGNKYYSAYNSEGISGRCRQFLFAVVQRERAVGNKATSIVFLSLVRVHTKSACLSYRYNVCISVRLSVRPLQLGSEEALLMTQTLDASSHQRKDLLKYDFSQMFIKGPVKSPRCDNYRRNTFQEYGKYNIFDCVVSISSFINVLVVNYAI